MLRIALPLLLISWGALAQEAEPVDEAKQLEMRARYEQALLKSPLQDQIFDRVYSSYLQFDGLDAWLKKLEALPETDPARLILTGRVYERQFKPAEAVAALEKAKEHGENRPEFQTLLGTLYYQAGLDEKAVAQLAEAMAAAVEPEKRAKLARMLGSVYLRRGMRDEAMNTWKSLAEQAPQDIFAHLELAEIYEDNRMWQDAIGVYQNIADLSASDPYRQCRALRSIGQCYVYLEKFQEAIATYEKALELVAPGNWLFEDLKLRLVNVYQDLGDLDGLSHYLLAKIESDPNDVEFRDLLAETYSRLAKFPEAEAEYQQILERDPKRAGAYEKLIALYERQQAADKVVAQYEKLMALFPTDQDYLRRMGEYYLQANQPDKAKETWQRLVATPTGPRYADLAGWYEGHEFSEEAVAAYQKALELEPNREWSLRLAALQHALGQEEAALASWMALAQAEKATAAEKAEIAGILESNNLHKEATPLWQAAVQLDDKTLEYRLSLANNLMKLEQGEEALPHYEALAAQQENEYLRDRGERGLVDTWRALEVLKQKQEEWEQQEAAEPENHELLTKLARYQQISGNTEKALELSRRVLALAPDNVEYARNLAALLKSQRQMEEAITLFTKLIEIDKNRAGGYYRELVEIYLGVDMKDEAIAAAQHVVEMAPSDPEARLDLAQVLMQYQQQEEAFQQYRYALRLEPGEPQYYRQYGEALMGERRFGEAQEAFRKMLDTAQEDETRQNAVRSLAAIYAQQDQLEDLKQEFRNRVRNTPKKLAAYEELAAIHEASGDPMRAVEILEEGYQAVDDKVPALKSMVRQAFSAQDFERVVTYYQELIARSGKPSSQEYQNLGRVYAQLGEIDKARETWNKIVEAEPEKVESYTTLARLLKDSGFQEEALAAKAKALDMEPQNYKLRYEYAQDLTESEQMGAALEQLQMVLDLGEGAKQDDEDKDKKEKQVKRLQSGSMNWQRAQMFSAGYSSRNYGYSRSWQGKFEEFRPQVIVAMARLAENTVGIEEFLKEYQERVDANPNNVRAKNDLMLVYLNVNQMDKALEVAEQLLTAQPEDVALVQQVAALYAGRQNLDRAIELMEGQATAEPTLRKESLLALAQLYQRKNDRAKADELVKAIAEEFPGDYMVYYQLVAVLQGTTNLDLLAFLQEKADALAPQFRLGIKQQLARVYQQANELEKAKAIYLDVFNDKEARRGSQYRGAQINLYAPVYQGQNQYGYVRGSGRALYQLQGVVQSVDYTRYSVLDALLEMQGGEPAEEPTFKSLLEQAETYATAQGVAEKKEAREAGLMAAVHYTGVDQRAKAAEILEKIKNTETPDVEWWNFRNYLYEQDGQFAEMSAAYDTLLAALPAKKTEVMKAKVNVSMLAGDYAGAAEIIRELQHRAIPPAELNRLVGYLVDAGEKDIARTLLDEHLAGISRNSEALALLAKLHAENQDYEKALEVAREAWTRKAQSSGGNSAINLYYGYYYPGQNAGDDLLREMHRYAQQCAKTPELIKEFEDRLAKQPGSIQLHQDLATLYGMNDDRENAVRIYKALLEKRPHFMRAKMQLAQFYQEKGMNQEALAVYEDVMKNHPALYRSVSWQVRELYQQMGKSDQLTALETQQAAKATNPNQLQQAGWDMQNQGKYAQAAEMFAKARALEPSNVWLAQYEADCYKQLGRTEDAFNLYAKMLESPIDRKFLAQQSNALRQVASLYRLTGRLDELEKRIEEDAAKDAFDQIPKMLRVELQIQRKQFDEAVPLMEELLKAGNNYQMIDNLIVIATYKGKPGYVLELLERTGQLQGYWNNQQLVPVYLAVGDRAKAATILKDMVQNYGGGYGYVEAFNQMVQNRLYPEAADLYLTNRRKLGDDWYGREMDNQVVGLYLNAGEMKPIVEDLLSKPIKGPSAELLERLTARQPAPQSAEMLKPLIEREPENKELLKIAIGVRQKLRQLPEALALSEQLLKLDENQVITFRKLLDILEGLGRSDEALDRTRAWTITKFNMERGQVLASALAEGWRSRDLLALKDQALQAVDVSQREAVEVQVAQLLAGLGGHQDALALSKSMYEKKKDAETRQQYIQALLNAGQTDLAYTEVQAAIEAGTYDLQSLVSRGGDTMLQVYAQKNALPALLDIAWNFLANQDRYNIDYYFDNMSRGFANIGEPQLFLQHFQEKALELAKDDLPKLTALSRQLRKSGRSQDALAIADLVLQRDPHNRGALQAKAAAFADLGRFHERVEVLAGLRPASLQEESLDLVTLAQAQYLAQEDAAAQQQETALLGWAQDAQTKQRLSQMHLQLGRPEAALALLQDAPAGVNPAEMAGIRALALAANGKTQEAIDLVSQELKGSEAAGIAPQALALGAADFAEKVAQAALASQGPKMEYVQLLAEARAAKGDNAAALQTFIEFAPQFMAENADRYLRTCAGFMADHHLVAEQLGASTAPSLLTDAVAVAVALSPEREEDHAQLLLAAALPLQATEAMLLLANVLAEEKQWEQAAGWYAKVCDAPEAAFKDRRTAVVGLSNCAGDFPAPSFLAEAIENNLDLLLATPEVLRLARKAATPEVYEGWLGEAQEALAYDSQKQFLQAMDRFYAGDAAGTGLFVPLLEAPQMALHPVQLIAALAEEKQDLEIALRAWEKVRQEGYSRQESANATAEMVRVSLAKGDIESALRNLQVLIPEAGARAKAVGAIAKGLTPAQAQEIPAIMTRLISEAAGQPSIGAFTGLVAELCERAGTPMDPVAILRAAQAPQAQQDRAGVWPQLIEQWQVSGPFLDPGTRSETIYTEDGASTEMNSEVRLTDHMRALAAGDESTSSEGQPTWLSTDPARELGSVNLAKCLQITAGPSSQQTVYAVTCLESPDARAVTFSASWDGNIQVWANGQRVYRASNGNCNFPDWARFEAPLKAGRNTLLVQIGGSNKERRLAMGVVEGGDGVTILDPASGPATLASAAADGL